MKTDHPSKESILAVQKMRTQIPALGHVVTPEDAVKMAEIIDAAKSGNLPDSLAEAVKRMKDVPMDELEALRARAVLYSEGLEAVRSRLIQAAKGVQP